jgi:hypothetical protein
MTVRQSTSTGGKRKPKPERHAEVAFRDGQMATESLPLPLVLYPGHYGTFFAFAAADAPEQLYLCSCAKPAVANYLAMTTKQPENINPLRMAPLDCIHFPQALAICSLKTSDPWSVVSFADKICHRCNLTRPSMSYCHPMYGGQFLQGYGWYVNQAYYRLGVVPRAAYEISTGGGSASLVQSILDNVCPDELVQLVRKALSETQEYYEACVDNYFRVAGPDRRNLSPEEVRRIGREFQESADCAPLRKRSVQSKREVSKFVENLVRQEFGCSKVGEGWVSESLLFKLVSRIVPSDEILRHHRPDWLESLELDIYIPELHLGIEYQGQQHFHAIEAWGGQEALTRVQQHDVRKLELCRTAGVKLLTVDYTEPLIEEHVRTLLTEFMRK